jgi:hypothetical protein
VLLQAAIKLVAVFPTVYFSSAWNCYDFAVVVASLASLGVKGGNAVNIARLVRVFRIFRLFR